MYVRCKLCNMKVQAIQNITCNFREKIQNFAKCKLYWGPSSIVVAPHFLVHTSKSNILIFEKAKNLKVCSKLSTNYFIYMKYQLSIYGMGQTVTERNHTVGIISWI